MSSSTPPSDAPATSSLGRWMRSNLRSRSEASSTTSSSSSSSAASKPNRFSVVSASRLRAASSAAAAADTATTSTDEQRQQQLQRVHRLPLVKPQKLGDTATVTAPATTESPSHKWLLSTHATPRSINRKKLFERSVVSPLSPPSSTTSQLRQSISDLDNSLPHSADSSDSDEPSVDLSWLKSFPLFGFSPRDPTDARYKALAKVKKLTLQHGLDDLRISDYFMAFSLYNSLIERILRRTSDQKNITYHSSSADDGHHINLSNVLSGSENRSGSSGGSTPASSSFGKRKRRIVKLKNNVKKVDEKYLKKLRHPFRSHALPSIAHVPVKDTRFRYWASSVHSIPPSSPRNWSPDATPPSSPTQRKSSRIKLEEDMLQLQDSLRDISLPTNKSVSNDVLNNEDNMNTENSDNANLLVPLASASSTSSSEESSNKLKRMEAFRDSDFESNQVETLNNETSLGQREESFRTTSSKWKNRARMNLRLLRGSIIFHPVESSSQSAVHSATPSSSNEVAMHNAISSSHKEANKLSLAERKKKPKHRRHWSLPEIKLLKYSSDFELPSSSATPLVNPPDNPAFRNSQPFQEEFAKNGELLEVQKDEQIRIGTDKNAFPSSKTSIHPQSSKMSADQLQLIYHIFRHAESIYGLPITVPSAPAISLMKIKDKAIVCRRTGLEQSDLLMSNFNARPFLPAFYVAIDKKIRSIVICVRGTANFIDSLTDVAATQDTIKIRKRKIVDDEEVESYQKPYFSRNNRRGHGNKSSSSKHASVSSSTHISANSSGDRQSASDSVNTLKINSLLSPLTSSSNFSSITPSTSNSQPDSHSTLPSPSTSATSVKPHALRTPVRADERNMGFEEHDPAFREGSAQRQSNDGVTNSKWISDGNDELENDGTDDEYDFIKGYGHGGVVKSAYNLMKMIEGCLLEATAMHPNFAIVVTGHSLGGATASILSLLLPNALSVGFGSPPCLTYDLAEEANKCALNIVNGSDIVPRLSVTMLLPVLATARYIGDMGKVKKGLLGVGLKSIVVNWADLEKATLQRISEFDHIHDGRRLFIPGRVSQIVKVHRRNEGEEKDVEGVGAPTEQEEAEEEERLLKIMAFVLSKGKDKVKDLIKNDKQESQVVRMSRMKFIHVERRDRGMLLAHATFSYRMAIFQALRKYGESIVPTEKISQVMEQLMGFPVEGEQQPRRTANEVWAELCTGSS